MNIANIIIGTATTESEILITKKIMYKLTGRCDYE